MNIVFYFLIGILVAFLFVFINKIIEKYKNKKWVDYIRWMRIDDETGLAFFSILLIVIWPLILGFAAIGGAMIGIICLFYLIGSGIYKAFNWICNKILK